MSSRALAVAFGVLVACGSEPAKEAPKPAPGPPRGLQFKVVDDGSPFMNGIYLHLGQTAGSAAEPEAEGITAVVDKWRANNGVAHTDPYLTASSRTALVAYFAKLATKATKFVVPGGRELGYEQPKPGIWRSYFLFAKVELDPTAIAKVEALEDPENGARVVLELTPAGAKQFGELTTRISGHKLVAIVDGTVRSAQVINDPLTEGRATIQVVNDDPAVRSSELHALAALIATKPE